MISPYSLEERARMGEARRRRLARAGLTDAMGGLESHVAVKAKRKVERQNRRRGRRQ